MQDQMLVTGVRVRGPLAIYAAGFADSLAAQGYVPGSVQLQVQLVSSSAAGWMRRGSGPTG